MENISSHPKIKIAFAIACLTAVSLYFATQHHRKRRGRKQSKQKSSSPSSSCYLKSGTTKPQHAFKKVLADNSYSPFKHLKLSDSNADKVPNSHPYENEVKALLDNPQIDFAFFHGDFAVEMNDSYVWVETESHLRELVDVLCKEKVFAVDTEQHSLRSFLGFTALIQISTRDEDYLVDTIALHDSISMLRPVFADPGICKVFHGADNDVLWLQRDFHIYVVNLFDTAKACEVLSKPQKSLAYLLETYCGVMTNKKLQREDWRQRPLPMEMVVYARMDAHYLLYIANCLIHELRGRENDSGFQDDKTHLFIEACRRSNSSCLQLYAKDEEAFPGESAASSIFFHHLPNQPSPPSASLSAQLQVHVIKLCAWRDLMARLHDESLRWVLSDHAISALVNEIPEDELELYNVIHHADHSTNSSASILSIPSPSPIIYSHWEDLCLLKDSPSDLDDFLQWILQRCLGSGGTCPLSIYNYSLLSWSNLKRIGRVVPQKNAVKHAKHVGRKASRDLFVKKFSCKAPVYHNCKIFASDGRLLCYCDKRKLEWYLQRKLAKLVAEDPPAIMLLFEPKGRPEDEDNNFYIQSKKNMCVSCGEKNHYLRYRIIPSCYRMHFPEHLKSHRSHDIVLLCVDCHEVAHAAAERYKRRIATEFGIPLFVRRVADSGDFQMKSESSSSPAPEEDGVSPLQLRTAAMALLRHGPRMPSERREELTETVKKYYGGRDISQEDLERALLVGMSPHEIRKYEKKRGLYSKHASAIAVPDEKLQNKADNSFNSLKSNPVGELLNDDRQALSEVVACNGPSTEAEEEHILLEVKDESISDMEDNHRSSRDTTNGAVDPCSPKSNKIAPKKHRMKVSLLGHGPHGKEVVDHLLKEYGEDGIQQFCQRWRQVFVDAIHPKYLPAGWAVKHSGRRDFGEFSVYKPANSASVALEDQV